MQHHTTDYIRFGAVCHSWRSVYLQNNHPQQLPLLMFTTDDNTDYQTRSFYSLADKKVLKFKVPVPHNRYCRGSTHGWLVTVIPKRCKVSLLNPFLPVNNEIDLPPLTTFDSKSVGESCLDGFFVKKAVLSANPTTDPNYSVMAIYGAYTSLAFFKPGDKEWISLDSQLTLFDDIIYYNNQFYAVNNKGEVYSTDLNQPQPKLSNVAPAVDSDTFRRYLVEVAGDLLQIARITRFDNDGAGKNYSNKGFHVFKFDPVGVKWIEMNSFYGHSIFIGDNYSFSLVASEFPRCKLNSIYFTDDYFEGYSFQKRTGVGPHDLGVFNLEDRSVEPIYYPNATSNKIIPPPIWVQPVL